MKVTDYRSELRESSLFNRPEPECDVAIVGKPSASPTWGANCAPRLRPDRRRHPEESGKSKWMN